MAYVFGERSGSVTMAGDLTGVPSALSISVAGWSDLTNTNILLQSFAYGRDSNHQISPTLRKKMYVYGFGEKLSSFTITGYAFSKSCWNGQTGFDALVRTYDKYSLAAATTLSQISISGVVIRGFLTGMRVQSVKPDLGMLSFNLSFVGIPQLIRKG